MIDSKVSNHKATTALGDEKAALPAQRIESRQALTVQGGANVGSVDPTTDEIAALAYNFWIERGSPHGSHDEDWYRAELQLRGRQTLSRMVGA